MYGLLVENLAEFIRCTYGEDKWEEIRRLARVEQPTFSTHHVYPDSIIPKLAQKATKVLGLSEKDFFLDMGHFFVGFVSQYGYDRVLSVLGRHLRDFLNGLDNLHEYLKFSYPRMRAPSFFCENENEFGLTLHYRSKRKGYVYYTMGQIKAVAKRFYNTEVNIQLIREELLFDTVHVTFQLHFENTAFLVQGGSYGGGCRSGQLPPVASPLLFEIFPFCIVFGSDMCIRSVGHSLQTILPAMVGTKITDTFDMLRPLIDFTWKTVLLRTNNIFELVTLEPIKTDGRRAAIEAMFPSGSDAEDSDEIEDDENGIPLKGFQSSSSEGRCLSLKGQMMYMDEWKSIIFIGTPMMQDLDTMIQTGLYINDLSMHDFSRDLMLAGTQQSVELKLALDQEQQKSKKLEESMRKLDEEMKRTDELLYQMIPREVADRLRKGEPSVATCEVFESVTILFSDVVTFTQICSRITPMEVVSLLNSMYSVFDELTEKHGVYKVETIGDAYMIVSGAPEKRQDHAQKICGMALDMMKGMTGIKDPSSGECIRIRIGIHSGTAVAGVVGLKMPRYCLFGDTVNTASRMESTGEAMKIHISETTRQYLSDCHYEIVERGTVVVKGKGDMKTYWLHRLLQEPDAGHYHPYMSHTSDSALQMLCPFSRSRSPTTTSYSTSPPGSPIRSPGGRSQYSPVTLDDAARHSRNEYGLLTKVVRPSESPKQAQPDDGMPCIKRLQHAWTVNATEFLVPMEMWPSDLDGRMVKRGYNAVASAVLMQSLGDRFVTSDTESPFKDSQDCVKSKYCILL